LLRKQLDQADFSIGKKNSRGACDQKKETRRAHKAGHHSTAPQALEALARRRRQESRDGKRDRRAQRQNA